MTFSTMRLAKASPECDIWQFSWRRDVHEICLGVLSQASATPDARMRATVPFDRPTCEWLTLSDS